MPEGYIWCARLGDLTHRGLPTGGDWRKRPGEKVFTDIKISYNVWAARLSEKRQQTAISTRSASTNQGKIIHVLMAR
ncbi:MAG: hypothetical protein ACRYFX_22580 [Janthinobacterium lividum]